jgi:hypothetical protein
MTMSEARYQLSKKNTKPPPLKKLPPTEENMKLHALRAHLQVLLWKSADRDKPPDITKEITNFGWEMDANQVMPSIAVQPSAPKKLLDVVSCCCKTCNQNNCSCKKQRLSCTLYCKCEAGDACENPHTETTSDPSDVDDNDDVDYENDYSELL